MSAGRIEMPDERTGGAGPRSGSFLLGRRGWAGLLLGFALGGFFDGILLHQILQWHHLLSALEGDLRFQVAADGFFHALMYLLAAAGLWMLWRSEAAGEARSGRRLLAAMLVGFGTWHGLDAVLSHWLLGIHRIRMDSAVPLAWDLGWLAVFGLLPLFAGFALWRSGPGGGAGGRAGAAIATGLTLAAGVQALQPAGGRDVVTVLFAPGTPPAEALAAAIEAGGRLDWSDPTGELLVLRMDEGASPFRLFRAGAILVAGGGFPVGCLGATDLRSAAATPLTPSGADPIEA